jgi:hypothetical protein
METAAMNKPFIMSAACAAAMLFGASASAAPSDHGAQGNPSSAPGLSQQQSAEIGAKVALVASNGKGLGHCKGVGAGHGGSNGKGHAKDDDCPASP